MDNYTKHMVRCLAFAGTSLALGLGAQISRENSPMVTNPESYQDLNSGYVSAREPKSVPPGKPALYTEITFSDGTLSRVFLSGEKATNNRVVQFLNQHNQPVEEWAAARPNELASDWIDDQETCLRARVGIRRPPDKHFESQEEPFLVCPGVTTTLYVSNK